MAIVEDLTDEECYLWAILSDPSGLDIAEFAWFSAEEKDGCFRAWPFQWRWWRNVTQQQIDQCARSVGKSLSIQVRAFAFPFIHPGQEMVITAPEGNHLDAITDNVETRFINTRLGAEMLVQGRSGVKHRPFHMNFANGSRIMGRIPQRDGKGVKGIHPIWLELDEAQDYPDSGWTEIIETLKQGSVGAVWRAHGVTRGMRDFFYKFTQPDSGWHIHQLTAMHRPTWSDEERQSKIQSYGSRDHPDYRRNVLGLHGDATNPLFVLHRLMQCVDSDNESNYNLNEYTFIKINNEMVLEQGDDILPLLDFPQSHMKYKNFWIGMDVGYTNHPSELVVFGETKERAKDSENGVKRIPAGRKTALKLLSRIRLERISHGHQVNTILWLVNFYKPHAFAMDKTGLGLPLFQDIQERAAIHPEYRIAVDTLKGYNFSGKILVDFDSSVEIDEYRGDIIQDSGIQRNVLEYSSDRLRAFVDDERVILPNHTDMIREFQGQTWVYDKSTMDMYGRKKVYSKGSFHVLDATRMAVLGFAQNAIEEMTKAEKHETVPSIFLY